MGRILFLLTPLREGRREFFQYIEPQIRISTHAPAGGATRRSKLQGHRRGISTHAPAGGATRGWLDANPAKRKFLLTPLREGRHQEALNQCFRFIISTHAPAGGATFGWHISNLRIYISTHAPAGGATRTMFSTGVAITHFYSRPCGRGDHLLSFVVVKFLFISTHAPAGGATLRDLLCRARRMDFYSRPCGRGDVTRFARNWQHLRISTHAPAGGATDIFDAPNVFIVFLLTPLREGRPTPVENIVLYYIISTHAPAGGATAIFHKSVMRFCGKLPKDDTVLCLASFGFPRRDPKAVYLAWISCANLPQKCAREGLALKDQGTSCFHEGLASHAFDPVLV